MKGFPNNIDIYIEIEDGVFQCFSLCPERSNPLSLLIPYLRKMKEGESLFVLFKKGDPYTHEEK